MSDLGERRRVFGGLPIMTYREFMEYPLDDMEWGGDINAIRKWDIAIQCQNCDVIFPGWFVDTPEDGWVRRRRDHSCP